MTESDPAGLDPVLRQVLSDGAASQVVQLPQSGAERMAASEASTITAKASPQS